MTGVELRIEVEESDADPVRIDGLALSLRHDLLAAEVGEVRRTAGRPAPERARGLDATTLGSLLVAVGSSALALTQAVAIIRGWVTRNSQDCRVKISVGDSMLTLSGPPNSRQDDLIKEFLRSALPDQAAAGTD